MSKRSFSPEFKEESADLVLAQGYSIREASKSMGVSQSAIRNWVKQLTGERQGITPTGSAISTDHQKIQELEARIRRVEREKEILKKATALLMSDSMKQLI